MNQLLDLTLTGLVTLDYLVLGYFLAANAFQTALLVAAGVELRDQRRRTWHEDRQRLLTSRAAPLVSVLAPAYNEASTIAASVRALLTLRYARLQLVVINDGSSDQTLQALQQHFDLVPIHPVVRIVVATAPIQGLYRSRSTPNLIVVDKANGGKADALNAGLNVATGSLVCAIDADTLIEPEALLRVVRPFLGSSDVVASGGTIRVVNGSEVRSGRVVRPRVPRRLLPGIQVVEYLRAFLFGRLGWNRLGGNLIISGAFGLFSRDAVLAAGGYLHDTVGEDMELVVRLRRHAIEQGGPGRVVFVPDPVAWTEAPDSARVLGRQRDRWHRGLADVIVRHRRMIGNPRYGRLGLVVLPCFVAVELLGPVIEAVGLIGVVLAFSLGAVDVSFAALFLLVIYGWGLLLSLAAVVLDQVAYTKYRGPKDLSLLVLWAVLENLGYRQMTVYWRLRGLVKYLRGSREWGVMARSGFDSAANDQPSAAPPP